MLKRTNFRTKSYEEKIAILESKKARMIQSTKERVATARKPVLGSTESLSKVALTPYKKRLKKIKSGLPKWLKAIPESSSHGSGTYERRLWKITSDYVRIRDWYKFDKISVDGKWLENWNMGDAGHYISYTLCKNMFKFSDENINLQSPMSNKLSSASDGKKIGDEINRRYGAGYTEKLEEINLKYKDINYTDKDVEEQIIKTLYKFQSLEERPEYVRRAFELKTSTV